MEIIATIARALALCAIECDALNPVKGSLVHGASGYHKRLDRSLRRNDESEQPDAAWDDDKIAEVTLEEAFEYFLRKLAENVRHWQTFSGYLSRFKLFYQDEIEAHLYDLEDEVSNDDSQSDSDELNFSAMKKADLIEYCRDNNVKGALSRKTKPELVALCKNIKKDVSNTECEEMSSLVRQMNELFRQLEKEVRNPEVLGKIIKSLQHIYANKLDFSFDED